MPRPYRSTCRLTGVMSDTARVDLVAHLGDDSCAELGMLFGIIIGGGTGMLL